MGQRLGPKMMLGNSWLNNEINNISTHTSVRKLVLGYNLVKNFTKKQTWRFLVNFLIMV